METFPYCKNWATDFQSLLVSLLEEEYINPFGVEIEENLVNLSPGVQVDESVPNDLLSLEER